MDREGLCKFRLSCKPRVLKRFWPWRQPGSLNDFVQLCPQVRIRPTARPHSRLAILGIDAVLNAVQIASVV